jgi:hypothetical protein
MLMLEFERDISEPGWDDTKLQKLSVVITAEISHTEFSIYSGFPMYSLRLYYPLILI